MKRRRSPKFIALAVLLLISASVFGSLTGVEHVGRNFCDMAGMFLPAWHTNPFKSPRDEVRECRERHSAGRLRFGLVTAALFFPGLMCLHHGFTGSLSRRRSRKV